jgi:hypothetical protein
MTINDLSELFVEYLVNITLLASSSPDSWVFLMTHGTTTRSIIHSRDEAGSVEMCAREGELGRCDQGNWRAHGGEQHGFEAWRIAGGTANDARQWNNDNGVGQC